MPTYDFKCPRCGKEWTITCSIKSYNDYQPICDNCEKPGEQKFSPPAIIFKGTGWTGKHYE